MAGVSRLLDADTLAVRAMDYTGRIVEFTLDGCSFDVLEYVLRRNLDLASVSSGAIADYKF